MTGRPVRWRTRWALAQVTGLLFSTVVWVVSLAAAPVFVAVVMLGVVVFVVALRTRPVLWLLFGARPAAAADRDLVLRAIVPVASLRGRRQPQVFIGAGRGAARLAVWAPGGCRLVVGDRLLARMRSGQLSDLAVSAMVARAFGQAPALGSRVVPAVGVYCLPWAIVETAAAWIVPRLSRIPLVSLSWRLRPVVFGLGLVDAVLHARWEAAAPLLVLSVLTYTTRPLRRAWQRRLGEMGDRRVDEEALRPGVVPVRAARAADAVTGDGRCPGE